ncbi:MAG: TatD family hydrolase [Proteobacteria bacterium]|nr:TatD family hydrolase [Pseudomonadota bacterium]
MKLFDSHCHLDDPSFDKDLDNVFTRMKERDVHAALIAGVTLETAKQAIAIAETRGNIYASVGIHPHDAKACSDDIINQLKILARNPKVRAWGETGLDFNRMFSPKEVQEKCLIRQLEAADELGLPLIFHERDSNGRFLDILKANFRPENKGVVHCFSGTRKELETYLSLGLYIGITGILTIKTRGVDLRKLCNYIPDERILIETDAPYLTPAPEKNQTRRNEPAFVQSTFLKLAEIKNEHPEVLAEKLWDNTCRLFNIELK